MSQHLNGNGTVRNSSNTSPPPPPAAPARLEKNESYVTFKTEDGNKLRGRLGRVTRNSAMFELYHPNVVLNTSESLADFGISFQGQEAYSGRAIIHSLIDAGAKVVCEVTLNESQWNKITASQLEKLGGQITKEFQAFLREWQMFYTVSPEFKVTVADMQIFLHDLKLWLDRVELSLEALSTQKQDSREREVLQHLCNPVMTSLISLFERFEMLVSRIEPSSLPAHSSFAKRLLHPLVLCSPFMHRTYEKPLGYAGDYEMVRMMTDPPFQGNSLYAKLLNAFFVNTPPVVAHRNRIDTLVRHLQSVTLRTTQRNRRANIFNLGCGPAVEIQRFMSQFDYSSMTDFTLLDFNTETVKFAQQTLNQVKQNSQRQTNISVFKKSVAQLIKNNSSYQKGSYDLVYCAGLFDYLPDSVCTTLLEVFYELAAPGGMVLVSNVDACNPSRGWMECMVDWYLVYRDANQMEGIIPDVIEKDLVRIYSEPSSVNIFAEIRKP